MNGMLKCKQVMQIIQVEVKQLWMWGNDGGNWDKIIEGKLFITNSNPCKLVWNRVLGTMVVNLK